MLRTLSLVKLVQAKAQIETMMQQADPTWNPHEKLEFFKLCVRTTLSQMGQITANGAKECFVPVRWSKFPERQGMGTYILCAPGEFWKLYSSVLTLSPQKRRAEN